MAASDTSPLHKLREFWLSRTLTVGAFTSGVDFALLITLVRFAGLDPVVASAISVTTGAVLNFLLNRTVAFRSRDPRVVHQAVRYVVATVTLLVVHTGFMYVASDVVGLNYLVARVFADLLVFTAGSTLLNRYVVFRPAPGEPATLPVADRHGDEVHQKP